MASWRSSATNNPGTDANTSKQLLSLYVQDTQFREIIAEFGSIMDFYARELDDS